jgi:hypothetical protein
MKLALKNDHPGYSCEKTHWVFVTGVEPLNFRYAQCVHDMRSPSIRLWYMQPQMGHSSSLELLLTQ